MRQPAIKSIALMAAVCAVGLWFAYGSSGSQPKPPIWPAPASSSTTYSVKHTDAEWHKLLTPAQYYILRDRGTEMAGTGKYNDFYQKGTYVCAATGAPIFSSDTKYDPHEAGRVFGRRSTKMLSDSSPTTASE